MILAVPKTFGVVSNGDRIPYISKHKLSSTISLQTIKFQLHINANYNGKFSTIADGSVEIPSYFTLDASLMYKLTNAVTFKSRILNILDESYAVSRAPAGLRPGHPFGVYAGLRLNFKLMKNLFLHSFVILSLFLVQKDNLTSLIYTLRGITKLMKFNMKILQN